MRDIVRKTNVFKKLEFSRAFFEPKLEFQLVQILIFFLKNNMLDFMLKEKKNDKLLSLTGVEINYKSM